MLAQVLKIEQKSNIPKYEQIALGITDAIGKKKLRRGDKLPSLNEVRKQFDVSINTVVKAYEDLKKRGVVDSTNGKGFHVATEAIKRTLNVFLLFDELNLFKQDLYNSFKETLGDDAKIDIFFHHYNFEVYKSLILDHIGRYEKYVIMPPPDLEAEEVLKTLDPKQVFILDQKHFVSDRYCYIIQDFEQETYNSFEQGLERLLKYKGIVLVSPSPKTHPELSIFADKIEVGTRRFCRDYSISFNYEKNNVISKIKKGRVYFVIPDDDLVELVKTAKNNNLEIGKDIGIVSFNDNKLKEVIEGGITTISTDFKFMGQQAAKGIMSGCQELKQISPASLILRNSL